MWTAFRLLLIALMAQGCAHTDPDSAQQLDCAALHKVIDSARENFTSIIGERSITRFGNTWRANTTAYGRSCSLLSSTDTPGIYFCSVTDKDQAAATHALAEAVGQCLGPSWQRSELPRPATRFTPSDDTVAVDVGASDVDASRTSAVGLTVRKLEGKSQNRKSKSFAQDHIPDLLPTTQ